MGVGLCANSHLEGTLAKLDEFGKSDAFRKSPSIFNLLKVPKLSFTVVTRFPPSLGKWHKLTSTSVSLRIILSSGA